MKFTDPLTGQVFDFGESARDSGQERQRTAAEETGFLEAVLANAGETFMKIGETTGINDLLNVNPAFRPGNQDNQRAMQQLEVERPVAAILGKAAPYAALPGGIAAQTAWSAATPFLEQGFTDEALNQSLAGAGMTRAFGVFGRILGRYGNAAQGRFGRQAESGVTRSDIPGGSAGRMLEQQTSSRLTGAYARNAMNRQNDALIAKETARWLGQTGDAPDVAAAFRQADELYDAARASAKPIRITADEAAEIRNAADLTRVNKLIPESGGKVDPSALHEASSRIRSAMRGEQGKTFENLDAAHDSVSDLMKRAGFDEDIKRQADKLYGRVKTLAERNVVEEAGEAAGTINLGPFRQAIRKGKATKSRSQKGLLDDDTKRLQAIVSDTIKDRAEQRTSTTPERIGVDVLAPLGLGAAYGPLAAIAAFLGPGAVAPALLGRAPGELAERVISRAAGSAARGTNEQTAEAISGL